jgi:hypothetical protein
MQTRIRLAACGASLAAGAPPPLQELARVRAFCSS